MNKRLVFVLHISVDNDLEATFRESLGHWIQDVRGSYTSNVQIDEVKVEED